MFDIFEVGFSRCRHFGQLQCCFLVSGLVTFDLMKLISQEHIVSIFFPDKILESLLTVVV